MPIELQFTEEDHADVRKMRDLLSAAAIGSPALSIATVLEARALAEGVLDRFERREAQGHKQASKAQKTAEVRS